MRFGILGPVEVCDGDRIVAFGSERQRALLAILLLHANEVVSVDQLIDDLWGERPPPTALRTLQAHVSRLRKTLYQRAGDPVDANGDLLAGGSGGPLVTRGRGYLLRVAPGELDLDRFAILVEQGRQALAAGDPERAAEMLRASLALWRGSPLADFTYEAFAQAPIARLEELRLGAIEERVEADLALGRHEQLVGELSPLVERDPLRERLRAQLMLALYRCGRQAEALAVYQEFRQSLSRELGLEPSNALLLLERSILMHDPTLDLGALRAGEPSSSKDEGVVVCPFKGLAFFDVRDAEYFYGREQIVADLVSRLASGSFAGIVGSSGSGKSSILRAGLVSTLAQGVLPGSAGWRVLLLRPGEHPVAELKRAFGTADISEALASVEPGGRIVLAVDQLEEVFTVCHDVEERAVFLDALVGAALDPNRRVAVVVALRVDFYGRCSEHPRFGELLSANHVLVGAMERGDLVRAIELPAGRAELEVERPLVEALVSDVAEEPGGLPLLSTSLLELWRYRDGRRLRYESYRRSGGVRGAVARLAEQAYARLDESGQDATRAIMLRLCSGEGATVARRRVPLAELDADRNDRVAHVLTILTDARLLTASDGTVEVAHEALLREWPRLQGWLDEDREGRRLHAHLAETAREWTARDRDPAELYRGARLSAALEWTAHHATQLSEREREFLDASRAANERQLRRLRMLLAGVAVLLAVAVAAGIVALVQRQDARATARAAKSRALAGASEAQLSVDPERSILLAMAAARSSPTADALFALRRALDVSPLQRRLASAGPWQGFLGGGQFVSYSPDGRQIAEGSMTGAIRIFDAASGRLERRIRIAGVANAPFVGYSPNGALLAVGTNRDVRILDVATGRTLLVAKGTTGTYVGYTTFQADNFAWSRDGSLLYFANGTQIVRWDLHRNRVRILAPGTIGAAGLYGGLWYVVLSRDGRRLAVGGLPGIVMLDAGSGRLLATAATNRTISWLALSPDGSLIAAAEGGAGSALVNEGWITLLDAHTLAPRRTVARVSGNWFTAVAFSPDGSRVAYGGGDGSAGVYSLRTGEQLVSLPGHTTSIWQIVFSRDGRNVVTAASDGTALIWRATGDERSATDLAGGFNAAGAANVYYISNLQLSSDRVIVRFAPTRGPDHGRMVVESFSRGAAGATEALAIGPGDPYHWYNLSPDGRLAGVSTATNGPPQRISPPLRIWDIGARRIVRTVNLQAQADNPPVFSPDDRKIALAVSVVSAVGYAYFPPSIMEIVDLANGRLLRLVGPSCDYFGWTSYVFSPDSRLLAAVNGCGQLEVWNTSTGRRVGRLVSFGFVNNIGPVRFSPNGKQLAVANSTNDGQVTILDAVTDRTVTVLTAHTRQVQDLAYSPDSALLATASIDHTVRIWDAHTGQQLRVLDHPDAVNNVAFTPDGKSVTTLDFDGTIRIWDACTDCENASALLALAKQRVTRPLTAAERRTFLAN
jgi:WD40 repeat protein/DNA-binding SARP family transcriptional activator